MTGTPGPSELPQDASGVDPLAHVFGVMRRAYEAYVAATPSLDDSALRLTPFLEVRRDCERMTKRYRAYAEKHFPERVTW